MSRHAQAHSRLAVHKLTYAHPDETPQFRDLSLALEPVRWGLVGPNGSGKTTLLHLLAGRLATASGRVEMPGSFAYVTQRAERPPHVDPDAWSRMSGGERTRARLAAALHEHPQWLLLDEPTNHLDEQGRADVYNLVRGWSGGLIVASHDLRLLDCVDAILEAAEGCVRRYALRYDAYCEAREQERAAARSALQSARAAVRREQRDLQDALEKSARGTADARKRAFRTGVDKMARGAMQRSGEHAAGRSKSLHEQRLRESRERAKSLEARCTTPLSLAIDLDAGRVPAGKIVVPGMEFNVTFEDGTALWERAIHLELAGPERVRVRGANGAGKTLLLRQIAASAKVRAVYVDQHLSILSGGARLADAMREAAPDLREHERRTRLARLGFDQERGLAPIASLSGGERVRAAFGMLFAADAPQLLVLDEPTNDLDAGAAAELIDALRAYTGALIVASHDEAFVERIGLRRECVLPPRCSRYSEPVSGRPALTSAPPTNAPTPPSTAAANGYHEG